MMKYHEQMKHPLWQKKRLEVMEHHNFKCQECEAEDTTLHVHHPFYKTGAMIWDYSVEELKCLCEVCHKNEHALDEKIKKSLSNLGTHQKQMVLGYIDSEHCANNLFFEKEIDTTINLQNPNYCSGVLHRFILSIYWKDFKKINKMKVSELLVYSGSNK